MITKQRPAKQTRDVTYWNSDGTVAAVDRIYAASFLGGLREVRDLQQQLIEIFVEEGGYAGEVLCRDDAWDAMQKLAALIPVVGGAGRGINLQALVDAEDVPQIARLFFTQSYTEAGERETDPDGTPTLAKPSIIAELHNLNFYKPLIQFNEKRREELMGQAGETPAVPVTPT